MARHSRLRPHWSMPPVTAAQRDAALHALGPRHWALLGLLAEHGVLDTSQVTRLLFDSRPTAVRHLGTLVRAGLVGRFVYGTDRTHLASYEATAAGLRAVEQRLRQQGRPVPAMLGREPSEVNEFFARLAAAPQGHLYRWRRRVDTVTWLGDHDIRGVRPQAYGVWVEQGVAVRFLLHVDHHEPSPSAETPPPPPARALAGYRDVPRGVPVTAILVLARSAVREHELHQALAVAALPVTVAATTWSRYGQAVSPAEAIWSVAGADPAAHVRLAELPAN
ncbi:replication-relaxation family protein [Dactylosporangium sp. CA-092794]|uniref:replication-relaxation family protein n=1 Tax=Dactylosporangium sp. CA-092794 TaxID=3239929 RepID=UPI003D93F9AF